MKSPKELTREDVTRSATRFKWTKKLPKWTVFIDSRQLPARPLVLDAAGVPPNDPTNSHQAVAILQRLGFETRYDDDARGSFTLSETRDSGTDISSLIVRFQKVASGHSEDAWERLPSELSANVDHYLYGTQKRKE